MKQADQTSKSQPSEQELESLSALMDAQTDELELRRLLRSMDQDPQKAEQLKAHWQRFHLAQDILHDRASPLGSGIAAAVAEQLRDEPAAGRSGRLGRWQQSLTRVAIAASVAVVFVVAMQSNLDDSATAPVAVNDAGQSDSLVNTAPTMLADSEAVAVDPVAAERLRSYLEGIAIDVSEPVVTEHIQDSPLYRLVNEIQD